MFSSSAEITIWPFKAFWMFTRLTRTTCGSLTGRECQGAARSSCDLALKQYEQYQLEEVYISCVNPIYSFSEMWYSLNGQYITHLYYLFSQTSCSRTKRGTDSKEMLALTQVCFHATSCPGHFYLYPQCQEGAGAGCSSSAALPVEPALNWGHPWWCSTYTSVWEKSRSSVLEKQDSDILI